MTGKQVFVRSVLTLSLPIFLTYVFFAELITGLVSAFRYSWLEVRIGFDTYRAEMRREDYSNGTAGLAGRGGQWFA